MKALRLFLPVLIMVMLPSSCDKRITSPDLERFCSVKPAGWQCEIIQSGFRTEDYTVNTFQPHAIIKYNHPQREFVKYSGAVVNPSLILNFYPVSRKEELIGLIKSQQMYSWCIPVYYGETPDFFIITSPCFINGGTFTEEAITSIADLQEALKEIYVVKDYGLI